MARSPIADNYEPVTRCIVCDAPVPRIDITVHRDACVQIEVGLAGTAGPEELRKSRRRPREKAVDAP